MTILAGTSRGLFRFEDGLADGLADGPAEGLAHGPADGLADGPAPALTPVLAERGVRELVTIGTTRYAGTSGGLFASADDGRTWRNAGLHGCAVWQVRASRDGKLIYAAAEPAALYRSSDAGAHWHTVDSFAAFPDAARWCVPVQPPQPARARALVVDQNDPRRLHVGVEVGGILRSADGGASWQLDLPGENPDIHMLCAHPADSAVLFASTGYGRLDGVAPMVEGNAGVFRSDDGGAHWQYVWHGVTPRYSRPMCIDPRPPYALTVASAPNAFSNSKEAGGAGAMLFRSNDRGATWRSLGDAAHTPSPANFHGLAPHPAAPGAVVVGTDTGEVWLVTGAGEWRRLATQLPTVLALLAN